MTSDQSRGWSTAARRRTLVALLDRLVPEDDIGPGAVSLGVVDYVERSLDGPHERHQQQYADGLDDLDALASSRHGASFADLDPAVRDETLRGIDDGLEGGPGLRAFFDTVCTHMLEGMFGDPSWGGNRDGGGWRMIGYPGPRAVWTEEEQQLDVVPAPTRSGRVGGGGR